mgnify:CR=1 FL=1
MTRTETLPPPLGPWGAAAIINVAETTVNEVTATEPKVTAVAFVKPEPKMETLFPPAAGPLVGFALLTTGVARVATPL